MTLKVINFGLASIRDSLLLLTFLITLFAVTISTVMVSGISNDNISDIPENIPIVLRSADELPPGAVMPVGCENAYPVLLRVGDAIYVACTLASPEEIQFINRLIPEVIQRLTEFGLFPDPVVAIDYDVRPLRLNLRLSRQLTIAETELLRSIISISFEASLYEVRVASHVVNGLCTTYNSPPTGSCNQIRNGAGTMGFRAKRLVCITICWWELGGTTWAHDSAQVGDTVFQPDNSNNANAYGTLTKRVCANGVDASFFAKNAGKPEMSNTIPHIGPVFGDWTGGVVPGLAIWMIGRFSDSIGFYSMTNADINANTCGTTGTSWKANWVSGHRPGGGDSGTGVCVKATMNGQNGCLRVGILWGTYGASDGIIFSPWPDVESRLGVDGY
ncbi:hypothetical protein HRbin01_01064 [archaeon HR01]|nr:hypothetical protein HRbin01_01064 [archaeon HR01]